MIYYVVQKGKLDYIGRECSLTAKYFEKFGAQVVNEDEFVNINVDIRDRAVIYINCNDETRKFIRTCGIRTYLHTIDESKSDGKLYASQIDTCKKIGCKTIINTYNSERNLEFLKNAGLNVIYFPLSYERRTVDDANKNIDVIITGQLNNSYYPERSRLATAIFNKSIKTSNVVFLQHPGFEQSKSAHKYVGEEYAKLLDRCKIGIVCKAGTKDRLVGKYIEYGFSRVLPVGDVPDYAPKEMKDAMIRSDLLGENVYAEIDRILNNEQELKQRTETYSRSVIENFDITKTFPAMFEQLSK